MISAPDRRETLQLIEDAVAAGARRAQACAELEQKRVGALVVCDGERVAGVFSERDVVRALALADPLALALAMRDGLAVLAVWILSLACLVLMSGIIAATFLLVAQVVTGFVS